MKAAVFHRPGVMVVEDVPVPTITEDEILIRVRAASICGTDLRISRHGHFKLAAGQHRVQGHEVAGEVVQVGREGQRLRRGRPGQRHPQRRLRTLPVLPVGPEQHVPGLRGVRGQPGRRIRGVPADPRLRAAARQCVPRCPDG